jgi:hypothetical protein
MTLSIGWLGSSKSGEIRQKSRIRTRAMDRKLRDVEVLPDHASQTAEEDEGPVAEDFGAAPS